MKNENDAIAINKHYIVWYSVNGAYCNKSLNGVEPILKGYFCFEYYNLIKAGDFMSILDTTDKNMEISWFEKT